MNGSRDVDITAQANLAGVVPVAGLQSVFPTFHIVEPGSVFGERLNQVDLRFTKIFRAGIARFRGMVDLYNVFNDNTVLKQSDAYGATIGPATGSAWQVPQAIIPGRVVKFGVQVNF